MLKACSSLLFALHFQAVQGEPKDSPSGWPLESSFDAIAFPDDMALIRSLDRPAPAHWPTDAGNFVEVTGDGDKLQIEAACNEEVAIPLLTDLKKTHDFLFVSLTGLSRSMHFDDATGVLRLMADTRPSTTVLDLLLVEESGQMHASTITVQRVCSTTRIARKLGDCNCN